MKYIKGGFTLVEMLITIGILSFLLIIFSQVIGGIFALQLKSGVTSTLSQDYHFLLSRLSYDVARASTFAVTSPTALDLTINSSLYHYELTGGNLTLAVDGGTPQVLNSAATTIPSLTFVINTPPSVTIVLTLATTYLEPGSSPASRVLTTTLGTRP